MNGTASEDGESQTEDMRPLLDAVIDRVPCPAGDPEGPLQLQVSSVDYSSFLGRLGIGKITSGSLKMNMPVVVADSNGKRVNARITKVYTFNGNAGDEVRLSMTSTSGELDPYLRLYNSNGTLICQGGH